MGRVHKEQSNIVLTLDTYIDQSTATDTRIYYIKPGGTKSYWDATVVSTTKLRFSSFTTSTLDEAGVWKIWTYSVLPNGVSKGEVFEWDIYEEGECRI